MELLPLYHCQVRLDMVPSGSVKVAVIPSPTWGCNVDRVTVPGSSTLVTAMVTAFIALVSSPRGRMPGP